MSAGQDLVAAQAGVSRRGLAWSRVNAEHLLALVLGLGVLTVHDVGYMLHQPFWNDESWVAVTTRFPLSQLPMTTSSTPIGWSLLLRLFGASASQTSRLLPLAFAGGAVVAGYWLARGLGWRGRVDAVLAGALAGIAVLLVPAMLHRDDLKQYTADACIALLLLALTSRLERDWSRWRLAGLSVAVWGGLLLSDVTAFVGVSAFLAVCLVQLARRAWRQLAEAAVAGAGTAVLMLAVYEAFFARAASALGTSSLWHGYYLPARQGLGASLAWVITTLSALRGAFGLGPFWLALPLIIAGLVTIGRLGRPATALAIAALLPEMIAVSALKLYPFGEMRTSTWLIVITVVVAAIGIGGICAILRQLLEGGAGAALLVGLVTVAAISGFAWGARPYVRSHPIPTEDVRDQASFVAAHAARDDVVLVSLNSNFSFAYYWRRGLPARRSTDAVRQGYLAYFPGQRIVVAPGRNLAGVSTALREAMALVAPGSCDSVWLVRSHVSALEKAAWKAALAAVHLKPVTIGRSGLSVVHPGGRGCG
jgi:hypothetical protein